MSGNKRLFIGIELNQIHKENLVETNKRVMMHLKEGRLTPRDNYHITLRFIGDTKENRIPVIEEIMQSVALKSQLFLTYMAELEEFKKGDKSTIWMGVKDKEKLEEIRDLLNDELEKLFHKKDATLYVPHITLVRNAEYLENVEGIEELNRKMKLPKLPILMDRLVLFESVKDEDEQKYINIYETPLNVKRMEESPGI